MRPNELKRRLQAGDVAIGCFVGFPSAEVVELCGYVGFDFVMIDAEHGPITTESAYHMILAAEVAGTTPLVRVPQNVPQVILRHMDIGPAGVMVPQVNSAEEARAVVEAVKYHPHGRRGLAGVRAAGYGVRQTLREYTEAANRETLVIVQIENVRAVERVAEIAAVPGVDVLFVGPSDLAHSMGYPGQMDHPEVQATIDRIVAAARESGATLGTVASSAEAANRLIERGFRMIGASASGLLSSAGRQLLAGIARDGDRSQGKVR